MWLIPWVMALEKKKKQRRDEGKKRKTRQG